MGKIHQAEEGPVMTKNRLKAGQRKLDATVKMERPADVSALQRLFGLIRYPSKFLQNLSEMREPLRRLTHKNASRSGLMSKKMPSKDQRRCQKTTSTQVLQREWISRGPRRCVQGWAWLFTIAAWSTSDI